MQNAKGEVRKQKLFRISSVKLRVDFKQNNFKEMKGYTIMNIENKQNNSPSKQPTRLSYKDLVVWQKSIEFASIVIDHAENLASKRKHYRLTEQLETAATSVPMNIAEGKGRISTREYKHFLMIARGSLYETMTLLEIFKLKNWLTEEDFLKLNNQAIEIARMLTVLHRNLQTD